MKKYSFLFFFVFIYHTATLGNTLYDLLGVSTEDFSQENLDAAHKRMRAAFHPDRNKAPDAEERFKEIQEAYDILSSPALRGKYDA